MEEKCLPPDSKVTRSNDSYCEGGGHDCRDGRWHRAAWVGPGAAPCPREHAPGWFKPHTWAPQKGPAPYSHWTPQEAARPGSARGGAAGGASRPGRDLVLVASCPVESARPSV